MPKPLRKQEFERRIKRGRRIRFMMDEKGIRHIDVMRKIRMSRHSVYLALRTAKMPTLQEHIGKIVKQWKVDQGRGTHAI